VNRPVSIASFRAHAAKISIIAPQTFSMDAQGFVAGEVPTEVMQIAAENHVAVTPLVLNRGFNQPLINAHGAGRTGITGECDSLPGLLRAA
jgi:hypothetical protein